VHDLFGVAWGMFGVWLILKALQGSELPTEHFLIQFEGIFAVAIKVQVGVDCNHVFKL
jgi:hypothetical protein